MEFKGTKGKWLYKEENHGQFIMCENYCVAQLNDHAGNETTKANAKLIASAPELLEMLQYLNACGGLGTEKHERIEALIKKSN